MSSTTNPINAAVKIKKGGDSAAVKKKLKSYSTAAILGKLYAAYLDKKSQYESIPARHWEMMTNHKRWLVNELRDWANRPKSFTGTVEECNAKKMEWAAERRRVGIVKWHVKHCGFRFRMVWLVSCLIVFTITALTMTKDAVAWWVGILFVLFLAPLLVYYCSTGRGYYPWPVLKGFNDGKSQTTVNKFDLENQINVEQDEEEEEEEHERYTTVAKEGGLATKENGTAAAATITTTVPAATSAAATAVSPKKK